MSIIMAAGDCNQVILISDGRWSDAAPNRERIVKSEDFKKIVKLNEKLFVAFAGNLQDCVSVIRGVSTKLTKDTTVEQYSSFIQEWIKGNTDYEHTDFNAQFIIAGKNSFGKLKFNGITCFNHTLSYERNNLEDSPKFTVRSSLDPSDDFITPLMQQGKPLLDQMKDVVKEASRREFSINDHVFYEIITL